ncbi:MAG TPA: PAS domain-containing protein, partial [Candidatus Limnocylindria bacterium]|nr:PAS domain-containing protein [Candidatus Limnocylindria bacterium]
MKLKAPKLLPTRARANGSHALNGKSTKVAPPASGKRELADLRAQLAAVRQSQAVVELDLAGIIQNASARFLALLGYDLEELTGRSLSTLVEPAFRDGAEYRRLWVELAAGRPQECKYKCLGKGGTEAWLQASFTPVLDADGKPVSVVQLAVDCTAQHKLAQEVAELRVRAEITNLTSIVSESDLKGDIVSINEKFIEVSKYSREELIGRPHNTTRHPDMAKETFKELWSTIGRGKTFRGIIKNRAKDGSPYYVDAVIAPVLGENGKPIKYIGVRYDITQMETERQNMKGVLGAIDTTYAYIEFDVRGNVLSANGNFLQLMGYKSDEVVGKHHRLFVDPTFANSPAYTQFWNDLAAGKSASEVFKRITKDRREVWIQAVYAPVKDEMGRVWKVVKIATDVTAATVAAQNTQRQIAEINRTQAVVEFTNEGICLTANDNFCNALGYRLDEIKGKHHSLFVEPAFRESADYRQFWRDLNDGKFQTAEFKRIGKGG